MAAKLLIFIFLLTSTISVHAQKIWDGRPKDSTEFTFNISDTIFKKDHLIDTSGSLLWRIGSTSKLFFSAQGRIAGAIMTDTTQPYPTDANDKFDIIIREPYLLNPIISFRHKYETTVNKDGGIVEYSLDSGKTWDNIKGDCNVDSNGSGGNERGILTSGFYSKRDTLYNGRMGFSGTSNGWIYSRLQFYLGPPMRPTDPSKNCVPHGYLYLRFRFVSDSATDTLDGWIIDHIKIERDAYTGSIENNNKCHLNVFPIPSYNGTINFPALHNEDQLLIEIYDAIGRKIITSPYRHQLNLDKLEGMFYYKVKTPELIYYGSFLLQ